MLHLGDVQGGRMGDAEDNLSWSSFDLIEQEAADRRVRS